MYPLQHRPELCGEGKEREEKFNRNSSSVSKLKIKLYHKGQCDQAQLTRIPFPCMYQHSLSPARAVGKGSWMGSGAF